MAPTTPSEVTWTLRMKNHKTALFLHVDPLQSLDSIAEELLRVLNAIYPEGRLTDGLTIPSDYRKVILGRPQDASDYSKGFAPLVVADQDPSKKGKRRVDSNIEDACPKSCGLKDGDVVAFKFPTSSKEGDEHNADDDDSGWDVVMPSYEEDELEEDEQ